VTVFCHVNVNRLATITADKEKLVTFFTEDGWHLNSSPVVAVAVTADHADGADGFGEEVRRWKLVAEI